MKIIHAHKDGHFECSALDSVHCLSSFVMSIKTKYVLLDPKGSLSTCLPTPAHEAVEIAIVDKGLGKQHDQYFIFMIALDAASSFIFFYATRSIELLELRCHVCM